MDIGLHEHMCYISTYDGDIKPENDSSLTTGIISDFDAYVKVSSKIYKFFGYKLCILPIRGRAAPWIF